MPGVSAYGIGKVMSEVAGWGEGFFEFLDGDGEMGGDGVTGKQDEGHAGIEQDPGGVDILTEIEFPGGGPERGRMAAELE